MSWMFIRNIEKVSDFIPIFDVEKMENNIFHSIDFTLMTNLYCKVDVIVSNHGLFPLHLIFSVNKKNRGGKPSNYKAYKMSAAPQKMSVDEMIRHYQRSIERSHNDPERVGIYFPVFHGYFDECVFIFVNMNTYDHFSFRFFIV